MSDATADESFTVSKLTKNWLISGVVLAFIGVGLSIYATLHHIEVKRSGVTSASCNISDTFSCDEVALSQYSEVFSIPVAVWGLGYFFACLVLCIIGILGLKSARENIFGYVGLVVVGVITSLVLATISYSSLGKFCPTCIGVYLITLAQLGITIVMRNGIPKGMSLQQIFSGGTTGGLAVAIVIVGFNFFGPAPQPQAVDIPGGQQALSFSTKTYDIPVATTPYSGLGEDYRKGGDEAKVTIVEFADFQCPACGRMSDILGDLAKEYDNSIRVVFRNYPLDKNCNPSINRKFHEQACELAVLARCAGQYGKFWAYHDLAFREQKSLDADKPVAWAKAVGLTMEQIKTCQESTSINEKVLDDIKLGNKIEVTSTPTIFINGRKFIGQATAENIRNEIEKILN